MSSSRPRICRSGRESRRSRSRSSAGRRRLLSRGASPRWSEVVGRGPDSAGAGQRAADRDKLAPKEAGAGLSPSIPPGMRALSVKVNDVIGVAGFTVPGARVDVVVVVKDSDNSMARAVVSNLQVLTAGTKYDIEQAKGRASRFRRASSRCW